MFHPVAPLYCIARRAVVFLQKRITADSTFASSLRLMKRELLLTSDGSHTIAVPELQVTYHSIHGAVQESRVVFMNAGLEPALSKFSGGNNSCLRLFEMGFGTGLNALLSLAKAEETNRFLYYQTAETNPLSLEEAGSLNYTSIVQAEVCDPTFMQMHECDWEKDVPVTSHFTLHKTNQSLLNMTTPQPFHLIYFDAFAPDVQPELWTLPVFEQMYAMLYDGGILVTYCSKGSVRRAMQAAGFAVEKVKGPPGKREIIQAVKQ